MAEDKPSTELDEIWLLFAQEGNENLGLAEEALLILAQAPNDIEQVKVLFRAVHSFKGGVRMMGLSTVEALAHHAEDLIAQVRDEGVVLRAEMIDLLLAVVDRLRAMLTHVLAERHDVAPIQAADMMARLQEMIEQNSPSLENNSLPDSLHLAETVQARPDEGIVIPKPTDVQSETSNETNSSLLAAASIASPLDHFNEPSQLSEFLKLTETHLGSLHSALDGFAAGLPDALAQIQSVTNELKNIAVRMGYQRLASIIDNLVDETLPEMQTGTAQTEIEARLLQFKKIELDLFEELTHIQDETTLPASTGKNDGTDIAWLFRHWNSERVYADLERLSEIADALEQITQHLAVEAVVSRQSEKLAEEALILLKAIYHSCIFYHLDPAVHLSLALADLYGRVAQGELIANELLVDLTRAYVTNLGSAIDAIREGDNLSLEVFPQLIEQAQNFFYLHTDGPVFQVTRSVLDVLKLPTEFKEVMTPETMAKFSRALQANEHFYTILADLERDEALGAAFLAWSQSEGIHLITNITVYRYNRTLFNFLVATAQSRELLLASLVQMDPQWQSLTLEDCVLREQSDLNVDHTTKAGRINETEARVAEHGGADVSAELVETIGEAISALVADHATLTRVVKRLIDKDLIETVSRLLANTQGDGAGTHSTLKEELREWIDGIQTLSQVESHISANMGELQQATRSLRLVPVSDMLNPLRRMVQELAQRQGKLVELDLRGGELTLDRSAVQVLEAPVRRLVWFAVTHSIEDVERRRAVGKPASGHVRVKVSQGEDHAQVMIEDDGSGLERETIRQRARELGWANGNGNGASELDLILKPGFGLVGKPESADGIDLAAIDEQLRARHGRLSAESEEGKGTHFGLYLPLDMAVVDGMIVRVGQVRYVVPVNLIRCIVKPEVAQLIHNSAGRQNLLRFEDQVIAIRPLARNASLDGANTLLMIVEYEDQRVAFPIDELLGRQQVLVRPWQGQIACAQNISGCALLGEGEVGVLLDLARCLPNVQVRDI